MLVSISIFFSLVCIFYEKYKIVIDSCPPSLECETNKILYTQDTYIPALIDVFQQINNREASIEHLDELYLLCKNHGYKYTKKQKVFTLGEWKKLIKKRLILDSVLREKGKNNLDLLKKELDRLNCCNYFENECLNNLVRSYVYRNLNEYDVFLMYPTSGIQMNMYTNGFNIDKSSFYKSHKHLIVYSTLISELPLQRMLENIWALDNSNPIKTFNEYVDVYQSDPRVYAKKYYDNIQYIFYNPARSLYASLDSEIIYDCNFGYDAAKLRKRFFSKIKHSYNSLESTLISEILTWTPEYVKKHPRYISNNENLYFMQLDAPCKSYFLILEFDGVLLQRIKYTNDIEKL